MFMLHPNSLVKINIFIYTYIYITGPKFEWDLSSNASDDCAILYCRVCAQTISPLATSTPRKLAKLQPFWNKQ